MIEKSLNQQFTRLIFLFPFTLILRKSHSNARKITKKKSKQKKVKLKHTTAKQNILKDTEYQTKILSIML